MTDLQWLSSKVNMLWVIYLKSLQELPGRLPETWRRDHLWNHWQTEKVGCWWQGSGGSMHLHFLGKANNLLKLLLVKTTNSCLPFNRLSSKPQQSQKISQNAARQLCPFPRIVSNRQSHNSHKRVLKMPSQTNFCTKKLPVFLWKFMCTG